MKKIPYLAVGNDELGEVVGEKVKCIYCNDSHKVDFGEQVLDDGTKVKSKMLGFIVCPEKENAYLVAVGGKLMPGWRNE